MHATQPGFSAHWFVFLTLSLISGLSGLVSVLRKRLGDSSAAVRRQVLLLLATFCERLGVDSPIEVVDGFSPPPAARAYKQVLPAVAECLCDPDRKASFCGAGSSR